MSKEAMKEQCCYGGIAHDCHAGVGCRIAERLTATPQQPAREPLTDDKYEAIVEDLADWSRYVEVDTAYQSLESHVRQVLAAHGITKGNT